MLQVQFQQPSLSLCTDSGWGLLDSSCSPRGPGYRPYGPRLGYLVFELRSGGPDVVAKFLHGVSQGRCSRESLDRVRGQNLRQRVTWLPVPRHAVQLNQCATVVRDRPGYRTHGTG